MIRHALLPWLAWGALSISSSVSAATLAYYRFEGEGAGIAIKDVKDSEGRSPARGSGNPVYLAVVGDAKKGTVTLYVNGAEEGFVLGYSGLYVPEGGSSWTMGRGQYNRRPADFVTGSIDEVRFSDTALAPSQFLYAPKKP